MRLPNCRQPQGLPYRPHNQIKGTREGATTKLSTMKTILSLFLLIGLTSCVQAQSPGIITQDVATFKKTIQSKKIQLVDVRTPAEFSTGSIEGAQNIDVKNAEFQTMAAKLDKKRPVAVYCRSGARSANAANILKEMGFKKIYNLDGGYLAWTK